MKSSTRIRICIILALSLPAMLLTLEGAYGQRGGFRPGPAPRPAVGPIRPQAMPPVNRPGIRQPGMGPRPMLAPRIIWITVWYCTRCGQELSRGAHPPAGCPFCNVPGGNFRPAARNVQNPDAGAPVLAIFSVIAAALVAIVGGIVVIFLLVAWRPSVGWIVTVLGTAAILLCLFAGLAIYDLTNEEAAPNLSQVPQPAAPDLPPPASDNTPDPNEGPPPAGWMVLFRSDDPAIWNTDSPGEPDARFALPVRRAHSKIRFLKLTRTDTGEAQIIPITHNQLASDPGRPQGCAWNGSAKNIYGGRHLGIVEKDRQIQFGTARLISVRNEGLDDWSGSGFGHKVRDDSRQCFCWKGQEIPPTIFEIAVTASSLTEEEAGSLLTQ